MTARRKTCGGRRGGTSFMQLFWRQLPRFRPNRTSSQRCLPPAKAMAMGTLFAMNAGSTRGVKRPGDGENATAGSAAGSTMGTSGWMGVLSADAVADMAVRTAQLVTIHDQQLRELKAMVPQFKVPLGSAYGMQLQQVDVQWKQLREENTRLRKAGGQVVDMGSKHLRLGARLVEASFHDPALKVEVREMLEGRWKGLNTNDPNIMAEDVLMVKWRATRDNKSGILEVQFAPQLSAFQEELHRLLLVHGSTRLAGTAPKGPRTRAVEDAIEATWAITRGPPPEMMQD